MPCNWTPEANFDAYGRPYNSASEVPLKIFLKLTSRNSHGKKSEKIWYEQTTTNFDLNFA